MTMDEGRWLSRALVSALWLVGASAGCGDVSCPPGSYDFMGRCIADDVDAGATEDDAGAALDAFVRPDGFVPPDVCTPTTGFVDEDLDGHGDPTREEERCTPVAATGFVASSDDCDDDVRSTAPGADELCDGVDQDCDGAVDEGLQGLIGTPLSLGPETDVDSMMLHAEAVGGSYVVAWNRQEGVMGARFDATGAPLASPQRLVQNDSEAFLRVVALDATHVVVVSLHRRELEKGTGFDATPVTVAPSFEIGETVLLEPTFLTSNAAVAFDGTDLTTIFDHETQPAAIVNDASLGLVARALTPAATFEAPRSLHVLDDRLWLLEGALTLRRLSSRTLVEEQRIDLPITDALARVATLDARGLTAVVGDESSIGVAHVALADLEVEPAPITRTTWAIARPVAIAPALSSSEAGADLVSGSIDGAELVLSYAHVDPRGGAHTEDEIARATLVRHVTMARLSSRAGAIFYAATDVAGGALYMQRIGCE